MTKTQAQAVSTLLKSIEIDISPEELKGLTTYDEVRDFLQDNDYFNVEIIYFSRAMEYLSEHDTSLRTSLELASDMGYEAQHLNSEILASILASENLANDFYNLQEEISEILE